MEGRNIHSASIALEAKLGKLPAPRCHNLAGLDGLFAGSGAAQHRRGAAEEATEARREVAVTRKSGIERNGRKVAAFKNGIDRLCEALVQDILVKRGANHLPEQMAQMKGREVRDIRKLGDGPAIGRRN